MSTRSTMEKGSSFAGLSICLVLLFIHPNRISGASIGVDYGTQGNNLPSVSDVASLVKQQGIGNVRIYSADKSTLQAFKGTGIKVAITVDSSSISSIANSQSSADSWISTYVAPFGSDPISTILVGNEVLKYNPSLSSSLVPAMKNLRTSLQSRNLDSQIKISTDHALDILKTSYPPSSGEFQDTYKTVLQNMLDFLKDSGSSFMVNVYPYFSYRDNSNSISLDYALGESSAKGIDDNGKHYSNLFDAQLDAVYAAMGRLNHKDISVVVTESGWPSAGGGTGSGSQNAATYIRNIVNRVKSGSTTPANPSYPIQVYIFDLFDENQKSTEEERSFGLFKADKTKKYDVSFS